MKQHLAVTIAVTIMALTSSQAFCQEQEKKEPELRHRYTGIGISVGGLKANDLLINAVPANKLMINIDAARYLRIEGQYGFFNRELMTNVTDYSTPVPVQVLKSLKDKSIYKGGGLMGMFQKDKARLVAGVRYGLNVYSSDNIDYSASGAPFIITAKGKMTILSGVIGGEYLFASYFSVGAEFTISAIKDKYDPAFSGLKEETSETNLSEGNLVFRFFPF